MYKLSGVLDERYYCILPNMHADRRMSEGSSDVNYLSHFVLCTQYTTVSELYINSQATITTNNSTSKCVVLSLSYNVT